MADKVQELHDAADRRSAYLSGDAYVSPTQQDDDARILADWAAEALIDPESAENEAWLMSMSFAEYEGCEGLAYETLPGLYLQWIPGQGFRLGGVMWMGHTRTEVTVLIKALNAGAED